MKQLDQATHERLKIAIVKIINEIGMVVDYNESNIGKVVIRGTHVRYTIDHTEFGISCDLTQGCTIIKDQQCNLKHKFVMRYIFSLDVIDLKNGKIYNCEELQQEVNFELYRAIHKNNSERIKQNVTNEVPKIQIMEVSLKKAFSLLDGRLSTSIEDVYKMLNYIFDENLFTHQLPEAINIVKQKNPEWFKNGVELINKIKQENNTNDFEKLMNIIDEQYSSYTVALSKINEHIDFTAGLFPSK